MKIKRRNSSFITLCLIQFTIYSFIILIICLFFNYLVNKRLENSFPVLEDLLVYSNYLESENYALIPKNPNFDFIIYADEEVVYATSKRIEDLISYSDIEFISDYYSNSYYYVLNKVNEDDVVYSTMIFKNTYDINQDAEVVTGYAILDSDLNIVEGDLFSNKEQLTLNELSLIEGSRNEFNVEKYAFQNVLGEDRTLIFVSPFITTSSYDFALAASRSVWFIAVPIIVVLIGLETFFFNRKIKKNLDILNNSITSYTEGTKLDIDEEKLPLEFLKVTKSFEKLLRRLKKSESEKEILYKEKQRMIANVSHDLKTPLTVIQGYAKAFLDDIVPEEKEEQYMYAIYNKTKIAVELIDSLFEFTQMDHPEYNLNLENINIVEFSKEYLAVKYSEIELKGMILDLNIPDKAIMASIDTKLFKRLYENLLNNSLKYNKAGTKIYFSIWDDKKYVYISIADNGVGIARNVKKDLFDPFVTSNNARTSGEGSGLGMAIAKKIVDLHNGKITLVENSKKGIKTEFDIIISKLS